MSIDVSKLLKEYFQDFDSHSVTHPSLQGKLQILEDHLVSLTKGKKATKGQDRRNIGRSNGPPSLEVAARNNEQQ